MKTFVFTHEQLSILIYALVASKEMIDSSQHAKIDQLVQLLNK